MDYTSVLHAFKHWMEVRGYKSNTIHMYGLINQELLGYLTEHRNIQTWEAIVPGHIEQYYHEYLSTRPNQRRAGGLSERYLRHHVNGLALFFSYLELTGLLPYNLISGLTFPSVRMTERLILSPAEVQSVFEHARNPLELSILHLIYSCGLRRTEAIMLNDTDLLWNERLLFVRCGKNHKQRYVPLGRRVIADLQQYQSQRQPLTGVDAFLLSSSGERMNGSVMNRIVQHLVGKAGIDKKVSLHTFRHSIASHLVANGMNSESVKELLGHSSLDTTMFYIHLNKRNYERI